MPNLSESQINMLLKQKNTTFFESEKLNAFFNFWIYIFKKIIFSLVSVKLWAFIFIIYISRDLLMKDYLNGSNFSAILICLIPAYFAAREYAKSSSNSIASKILDNPVVDSIKDKILKEDEKSEELDD